LNNFVSNSKENRENEKKTTMQRKGNNKSSSEGKPKRETKETKIKFNHKATFRGHETGASSSSTSK
jgi:hypothetical protein